MLLKTLKLMHDVVETSSKNGGEMTFENNDWKSPSKFVKKNHPEQQIISHKKDGVWTQWRVAKQHYEEVYLSLLSEIKPKTYNEASKRENWNKAMKEDLSQAEK